MKNLVFLTREEAFDKLPPDHRRDRWRNYELEYLLSERFPDEACGFVISENCPFNGRYTRWELFREFMQSCDGGVVWE